MLFVITSMVYARQVAPQEITPFSGIPEAHLVDFSKEGAIEYRAERNSEADSDQRREVDCCGVQQFPA